jgi:hypothetical protein
MWRRYFSESDHTFVSFCLLSRSRAPPARLMALELVIRNSAVPAFESPITGLPENGAGSSDDVRRSLRYRLLALTSVSHTKRYPRMY